MHQQAASMALPRAHTQGLPPARMWSFIPFKPCSLTCNFLGVDVTMLTVLQNVIPTLPHIFCLCKAVSSWCCWQPATALWEFPRQNPTLPTVSWGFRASGFSIEMVVTYCLRCGNRWSSEGFISYKVLTMLGEGTLQLISIPCIKRECSSSHTCWWGICLNQVCFSC